MTKNDAGRDNALNAKSPSKPEISVFDAVFPVFYDFFIDNGIEGSYNYHNFVYDK